MTTVRIVEPADWWDQIQGLIAENWAETGMPFDAAPSRRMYEAMIGCGLYFAVGAVHRDKLVGYCTVGVVPSPHNPDVLLAANDALFVTEAYRKGLVPGRMILFVEREAKARGARWMMWHCRAGTPMAQMMTDHGYQPVDVTVAKEL